MRYFFFTIIVKYFLLYSLASKSENAFKIKQFEELRDRIENGTFTASLSELRGYLSEIDEGIFGFVPDPEKA